MYPDVPGSAIIVELTYHNDDGRYDPDSRSGAPIFRNVTFEDITAVSAGIAGHIHGLPEDCLQGLTLRNVHVGGPASWWCQQVDLGSLTIDRVTPPLTCTSECNNTKEFASIQGTIASSAILETESLY